MIKGSDKMEWHYPRKTSSFPKETDLSITDMNQVPELKRRIELHLI